MGNSGRLESAMQNMNLGSPTPEAPPEPTHNHTELMPRRALSSSIPEHADIESSRGLEADPQSPPLARPQRFYGDGGLVPRSCFLDLLRGRLRPKRVARMEQVLLQRCERVTLLLENLADPHNGAAILRTCECFGIQFVHVLESIESFRCHSHTVPDDCGSTRGVSRSCDQWLRIRRFHQLNECLASLRANGYSLIGTTLDTTRSVPIDNVDFTSLKRICIVLGNEERGLSSAMQRHCEQLIHLPMVGFSQSLNVSVAAACMLYHLRMKGCIQPDLSPEQVQDLYTRWLVRANRNLRPVLERNGIKYDEI
jgi:tRNA (guanosine-2'-O-)-methyltransferase